MSDRQCSRVVDASAYTFRMTNETLERLRSAAPAEDRSIQWVFDKIPCRLSTSRPMPPAGLYD